MSRGRAGGLAAAALALILAFALPATAEDLTPDQARAIALRASVSGDYRLAYDLGRVLLERDPDDLPALLAVAGAAPRVGNPQRGIEAAGRAFRLAPNRLQRFNAAYLRSQAEFAAGNVLRSQFWLRRASSLATTDRQAAAVASAFRRIRAVSPLNLQFGFGIRPTSNANGGSSADSISYGGIVFGLSGAAQALPGIEYSGSVTLRYVLDSQDSIATRLYGALAARTYSLTQAARDSAPGAKGSDYAYTQVQLGLTHDRRAGKNAALSFGAIAGRSWYGGAPLLNSLVLSTGYFRDLDARTRLSFNLSGERQWRLDATARSADIVTAGFGATRKLGNGDTLRGEIQASRSLSDAASVANSRLGVTLGYDFAREVAGMKFGLSLGAGARHFPQSVFVAGPRDDAEASLGVSVVFTRINSFGFSPRLDVTLMRVDSSDDLYDRNDIGLKLGLQSNF